MSLSQIIRQKKYLTVVAAGLLMVLIGVAAFVIYRALRPSTPVLRVDHVREAPRLDGILNDAVWDEAEPVTLSVKDGPEVTVKAVYTDDRIYLSASYEGDKRGENMYQWSYDGETWTRGPANDIFAIFFNVDNSVKGFNEKGFGVMETPLPFSQNDPRLGGSGTPRKGEIRSKRSAQQAYPYILLEEPVTADLGQRGEMWEMTMGISNQFNKCQVYLFKPYPPMTFVPEGIKNRMVIEFDHADIENINNPYFINRYGITNKEDSFRGNLPLVPAYKYKSGKSITNTPYPRIEDMEPIADMSDFKKGDKLPFVIFDDKDWDGKGFSVDGKATFRDGNWTIEMSRALDTKQLENVVFKPSKDGPARYYCAVLLHAYQMNLVATSVRAGPVMIMEMEPKEN